MRADLTSHKQDNFFSTVTSLDLSKCVHIGITRQDYKKLAEPAEIKSIVKYKKNMFCSAIHTVSQ
jgi:hypothetical protein